MKARYKRMIKSCVGQVSAAKCLANLEVNPLLLEILIMHFNIAAISVSYTLRRGRKYLYANVEIIFGRLFKILLEQIVLI